MSDYDDFRAEWEAMADVGSERVLDQEAIDSLLGFDPPAPPPEDGWRTMTPRERARALGGYHAGLAEPFLPLTVEIARWQREVDLMMEVVDRVAPQPPHSHGERDQ